MADKKSIVESFLDTSEKDTPDVLIKLGLDLATKLSEAAKARSESGIEDIWANCEDAYLAIDDLNRSDKNVSGGKWIKPTSMEGGITSARGESQKQSTSYVRLTSRYVDMGSAKVCDILLPIDDKAFSLSATPNPHLIKQKNDLSPAMHPISGMPMTRPATDEESSAMASPADTGAPPVPPVGQAQQGMPPATPQVPVTKADIAQQIISAAEDAADRAETRIYGWMCESNWPAEMRKVVHDSARIGVGIMKGPTPVMRKSQAIINTKDGIAVEFESHISPASEWKDPWNIFPDPACGERICDGDYVFERDFLSSSQLKKLKKDKSYISKNIDKIIAEGPNKVNLQANHNPNDKTNKNRYEVFYFTGVISRDELNATKAIGSESLPDELDEVHAICTIINDTVIRAAINPMESGNLCYYNLPWSRRPGSWDGVGVGEQVSMPQRMVNAGTRTLLNNAGLSSGLQFIMDPFALIPADGNAQITPNKLWYKTLESTADDVRKLFLAVEFPNQGPQLMAIIEYGFKLAEQASNIPLISQGQTGATTPLTFGATELQDNNAHSLLRNIALSVDDNITNPSVHSYYEWLLLDPSVPDDEKGDFQINAKGSMAMVEKAIQEENMVQVGQMIAGNPAYRGDPKRWFVEYLKGKRLDPRKYTYSPDEQAKMDATPPPAPIQLQVQQAKSQTALQVVQAKSQAELQMSQQEMASEQQKLTNGQATPHMASASAKIESERIRAESQQSIQQSRAASELQYVQTEAQIARDNAAARIQELELKERLELLKYANQNKQTLMQVQADLAKSAMDNRTKRELAATETALHQSEGEKVRDHELTKLGLSNAHSASQTNISQQHTADQNQLANDHESDLNAINNNHDLNLNNINNVHETTSAELANEVKVE